MQATANSTSTFCHSSTLLRMRDVVGRYNVAETTVRRATGDGSLTCLTLPSGHRRFRESDVLEWLGIQAGENDNGGRIPIAAICRVSTCRQSKKVGNSDRSSLEHQEGRVSDYIDNRWGSQAKVTWYRSVGSGMNFERKEFLQLIADVLSGKYRGGYIVATDFTRICRFGIRLVEFLAAQGECKIVYTMATEDKDLNETLSDEILSILTHYTAKASGQKNKAINETKIDESTLAECYRWYKGGLSYRGIAARLKQEGRHKDAKGRVITKSVIMNRLKKNWAALEKLYSEDELEKNSFEIFVEKFVEKVDDKARLKRRHLIEAYQRWCEQEGLAAVSSRQVTKFTNHYGWKRKLDSGSAVNFCGLRLITEDKA